MESKKCVHCGICTQNCLFLQKYGMDIGKIQSHPELAYHCFLCGRCTQVCPLGIDGRENFLSIRQELVQKKDTVLCCGKKGTTVLPTITPLPAAASSSPDAISHPFIPRQPGKFPAC